MSTLAVACYLIGLGCFLCGARVLGAVLLIVGAVLDGRRR
jgi:hypothetical protein